MAGVCRFLESRTMYQVISKVVVCAVVCVLVITVTDAITHPEVNEHGCNFNCAVIVRYIARDPARQLPDACVTREMRLHHAGCTSSVDAKKAEGASIIALRTPRPLFSTVLHQA